MVLEVIEAEKGITLHFPLKTVDSRIELFIFNLIENSHIWRDKKNVSRVINAVSY